ncbi:hypothetical protein [Stieleria varia]|uniref:Lipoprotein n=1 Tax=Stieleria varia TaxID=2528005 RepID=A0A5C6APF3_9BACT|nr:hypothetical protein [Stieleria varia]TWU01301.1 hypothetical protein Pla52n_46750 [Stieleria varia]
MRTPTWIIIALVALTTALGCAQRQVAPSYPPPPTVLNATPGIAEVAAAVNRTASIRQLSSNTVVVDVLSMPSIPKLSGTLALERDRRFRMRANLPVVLGAGMDMGSNDQVFWFEVPEGMSKVLYYAGHDAYRQQLNRAILPVDPTWIMDALGLIQIDPNTVVSGPTMRADGKLELRSLVASPSGNYQRVLMIDANAGYVTDQFLYGPMGTLVASSQASQPRYYENEQCVLPHTVELTLTPAAGPPLSMRIEVGSYAINQLLSSDPNLFTMPQTAAKAVDLTTLSMPASGTVVTPVTYDNGQLGPLPYRGLIE